MIRLNTLSEGVVAWPRIGMVDKRHGPCGMVQARFCKCRVFRCSAKRRDKGAEVLGRVERWRVCELGEYQVGEGKLEGERGNCARQVRLCADSERREGSEDSAEGVVAWAAGRVDHES